MLDRQGAGDRHDPGRALEQPGDPDLIRARVVIRSDLPERRRLLAGERVVGHEEDLLGGAVADDVLVLAVAEAVLVLYGRDGDDRAGGADLFDRDRRQADVADPAGVDVLADELERRLERRVVVDAVEVPEVERLGPESVEALLDLGP